MQFLQFTFQDFWHFVGVLILLTTVLGSIFGEGINFIKITRNK